MSITSGRIALRSKASTKRGLLTFFSFFTKRLYKKKEKQKETITL
jgi:hypothetical protein